MDSDTATYKIRAVHTLEEAVEQGAKLLDHYRPGWHNTVRGAMTKGLFDMTEWSTCMVGTLELAIVEQQYGGLASEIRFNGLAFNQDDPQLKWIGFVPIRDTISQVEWEILDDLWAQQVRRRLPDGEILERRFGDETV